MTVDEQIATLERQGTHLENIERDGIDVTRDLARCVAALECRLPASKAFKVRADAIKAIASFLSDCGVENNK